MVKEQPITHHTLHITKKWYAIYVKSRHEKVIFSELRKKGIESSLPLMTTIRQWSDRRKKVEVPLFRSYLFVKIELKTEKMSVLQTLGVVKFVDFNREAVTIPEQQMYWLIRINFIVILISLIMYIIKLGVQDRQARGINQLSELFS